MAKTRKAKVLKVDSADKISELEGLLKKGSITFVLIYADWCGACTRFKKNIWNPMCEKSAAHTRVAVRDDMVKNTSLASANFDYLPSLIVVDEKGRMQSFKTPEGKDTNAMPTPQSLHEMNTIVNVPVSNVTNVRNVVPSEPVSNVGQVKQVPSLEEDSEIQMPNIEREPILNANEPLTLTPQSQPKGTLGKSYIPTPMVAPMRGGGMNVTGIPKKVLRGLAGLFKRSRKNRSHKKRNCSCKHRR